MKNIPIFLALLWAAGCAKSSYEHAQFAPPTFASFEAQQVAPKFQTDLYLHTAKLGKKYPKRTVQIGYLYSYAADAKRVEREIGLPASLTIAVAMLETGYGQSGICTRSANHFNIKKGDGWSGQTYADQRGVLWRAYSSPSESFDDFGSFILKRVPHLIAAPTPANFAKTGYAGYRGTVQYAAALQSIIDCYELVELFKN